MCAVLCAHRDFLTDSGHAISTSHTQVTTGVEKRGQPRGPPRGPCVPRNEAPNARVLEKATQFLVREHALLTVPPAHARCPRFPFWTSLFPQSRTCGPGHLTAGLPGAWAAAMLRALLSSRKSHVALEGECWRDPRQPCPPPAGYPGWQKSPTVGRVVFILQLTKNKGSGSGVETRIPAWSLVLPLSLGDGRAVDARITSRPSEGSRG